MVSPFAAASDTALAELVRRFYDRVRRDPVLAPVFVAAIGADEATWAAHVVRLTDFWSSIMNRSGRYHGDPFSAHLRLHDLEPAMFERWLGLFQTTCEEIFEADVAALFASRASRIARSLRMGLFDGVTTRSSAPVAVRQPDAALAPPGA